MTKLLISLYILVILLIAGFAHAEDNISNSRIKNVAQIPLAVQSVSFDSGLLKITGPVASQCLENKNITPVVRVSGNSVYVSVNASENDCSNTTTASSSYEVVIDLNAYFAQHPVTQDTAVQLAIENYNGTFDYVARSSAHFAFDQNIEGTIAWSRLSKGYVIETPNHGEISLLPTFDLKKYINKKVQVKAESSPAFALANNNEPRLFIGQLVVVK